MGWTFAASLLVVVLLPAAWIGIGGGADLDVGRWRIEWFEIFGPVLACAGAFVLLLTRPPGSLRARVGCALACLAFAVTALALWSGGIETEFLRIHRTLRPAALGWLALIVGLAGAPRVWLPTSPLRVGISAALTLALGYALASALLLADRNDLARRIRMTDVSTKRGDVILLMLDTLRADALGAYGAEPSPSPFMDALARESVVFDLAVSQAPWTVPSVASLMSSLHPSTLEPPDEPGKRIGDRMMRRMPPDLPWLGKRFRDAGYHTAAFVKNPLLRLGTRFETGFEIYEDVGGDTAEENCARQLVDATLRWGRVMAELRAQDATRDFLLYVHFMDPHIKYQPPSSYLPREEREYRGPLDGGNSTLLELIASRDGPTPEDIAHLRARYNAEVTYLDAQLRRLHDELSRLGLWSDATAVVLLADHGEQFGEHGDFQHNDIHIENVHVPLMIRMPGVAPRRISTLVRLLDVTPTLLEAFELEPLPDAEGRSLLGAVRGDALMSQPAVTEFRGSDEIRVMVERYALLVEPESTELYDLRADPGETRNLAERAPGEIAKLRAVLTQHENRERLSVAVEDVPEPELDRKTRDALEALGYLK